MSSVPTKKFLKSAIATADWFLGCQKLRDRTRFEKKFNELLELFKDNRTDENAYSCYIDVIGDVFDILAQGKVKGSAPVCMSTAEDTKESSVEKSYQELLNNTQDYIMFIFVFAQKLDTNHPEAATTQTHVLRFIETLKNLKPRYYSDKEPAVDFPEFRLQMMMGGFNFLSPGSIHALKALGYIIEYAAQNKLFSMLIPYIYQFERWMSQQRQIPITEHRQLYKLIINELKQFPKHENDLLYFYKKYIQTATDLSTLNYEMKMTLREIAVELLVLAISNPTVMTFDDIMESKAVTDLKNSPHQLLYQLGVIFYLKGLKEFSDFVQTNQDIFSKYNLHQDKCLEKMQLIVLASMPLTYDTDIDCHYSLEDIAKTINISIEEAERLTIRAIKLKYIDGRIDQRKAIVEVKWNLHRHFGKDEWVVLKNRLTNLQKNVQAALQETTAQ